MTWTSLGGLNKNNHILSTPIHIIEPIRIIEKFADLKIDFASNSLVPTM